MLFLLNDTVLDLDLAAFASPLDAARFRALSLPDVMRLGAEMFAQSPLLHRQDRVRASRLAMLIAAKHPEVNAALFVAPERGCRPEQVATNFAQVSFDVMAALYSRDRDGALTPADADRQVWRRMAA
jgi:hypothetical protein